MPLIASRSTSILTMFAYLPVPQHREGERGRNKYKSQGEGRVHGMPRNLRNGARILLFVSNFMSYLFHIIHIPSYLVANEMLIIGMSWKKPGRRVDMDRSHDK